MGMLESLLGVFSRRGTALSRYRSGMAHAKVREFQSAIKDYTHAIDADNVPKDVQAMAIYNRSLAYSSTGEDEQAAADLERLLQMKHLPDRIRTQALQRQHRITKRESKRTEAELPDS